jgi:ABC-type uncharacterized transport system permease subunit
MLAGGFDTTLYLFALLITIVFIGSQLIFNAPLLGAFVSGLIMTLLTYPSGLSSTSVAGNPWILIHIADSPGRGAIHGSLYLGPHVLVSEQRIKSKRVGSLLQKFLSLTTLDKINHVCLIIGFPLITVGLALGLLLMKEIWGCGFGDRRRRGHSLRGC